MENTILYISLALAIVSLGWLGYLSYRFFSYLKEKEELLKKARNKNLESLLEESLDKTEKAGQEIKKIHQALDELGKIALVSITKVATIRYNPFQDTGGDQSFSMALLNAKNNGIVLSSLHGREGTRVYCKPIEEGKSEYHLTEEEVKVIAQAQNK